MNLSKTIELHELETQTSGQTSTLAPDKTSSVIITTTSYILVVVLLAVSMKSSLVHQLHTGGPSDINNL